MSARPVMLLSNHAAIVGGGEISLLSLLESLDRRRWAPIVVTPGEGAVARRSRSLGLPTHVIPWPPVRSTPVRIWRTVRALTGLIDQTRAVLLHANGSRAMFYAGWAGRLRRRPVLWHVRVGDRDGLLDRVLTRLAAGIVVNSRAVGRRFARFRNAVVSCVYNGVDLHAFRPRPGSAELRYALGLRARDPVVLSVGRFVSFKGYEYLLHAAGRVNLVHPEVQWLLVGDGELRGPLERQAHDLCLTDAVHFTGWREDVPDLLALSDCFALPSLGEHFGRVLIEAMAAGRPVVATEAGGVPEIVVHGETGLLVPPADAPALGDAILRLVRDPLEARRLGAAGRRRAEQLFSAAAHAARIETLYTALMDDRRLPVEPWREAAAGRASAEGSR